MLANDLVIEKIQSDLGAELILVLSKNDMRLLVSFASPIEELGQLCDLRIQVLLLFRMKELLFTGPGYVHEEMASTT